MLSDRSLIKFARDRYIHIYICIYNPLAANESSRWRIPISDRARVASRRANRQRTNVKLGILAQLTGLKPGRGVAQGASKRGLRAVQEEQR